MDIRLESIRQNRKKRSVINMLSVFGDESTDEKAQRIFAVAGIIGTQEEWDALEPIWLKCTGGKIFHAADCESSRGDYKNIPIKECHREYKELTQILTKTNMMGFGVAMDIDALKKYVPDAVEGFPYYQCFIRVVGHFAKIGYLSIPQQKVKFTFDRNVNTNYNSVYIVEYLSNLSEYDYYSYIDEISFASREKIGIQAADLLARETLKYFDSQFGPKKRVIRRSMLRLLENKKYKFHYFHKYYYEWLAQNHKELLQKTGLNLDHYKKWLIEHRLNDNASNKSRYLIYLESLKRVEP